MNKLQIVEKTSVTRFTDEEKELLKSTIAPGLNESEFKVFMVMCERTGLDPFRRQIYAVKRGGKMVIQTGIDGYRATASRTGQYAGSDDAIFDSDLQPKKATVTVYRFVNGARCPFTASARWNEYYPGKSQGFNWDKMPYTMLGKCAEALALRKAFPEDLAGIYTDEEMQQAGPAKVAEVIDVQEEQINEPTEFQDQSAHIKGIVEEKIAISELKVGILNHLIGKGKPFGNKVIDAKKWCEEIVQTDFDKFTFDDCAVIMEKIEAQNANNK